MMADMAESKAANAEVAEEAVITAGIRVILADSQAIYRVGLRKVFALEDDIRVIAQAEDAVESLRCASAVPDRCGCA